MQLIDRLRSSPRGLDASTIVQEIEKHGLAVTDDDIREIMGRRDGGGFIPPKRVVEFVLRLAAGRQISTALDFGCGVVGLVGKALEQQKAKVTAVTQITECAALSRLLCKETTVEVDCSAPLAWLEKTKLRFDFVFGMPPFGLKSETPLPFLQETPTRNIDSATAHAAWAGSCLTDDGIAVLVVPTGFAEIQSHRSVETLNACGLNLIAYLSLPPEFSFQTPLLPGHWRLSHARRPSASLSAQSPRTRIEMKCFSAISTADARAATLELAGWLHRRIFAGSGFWKHRSRLTARPPVSVLRRLAFRTFSSP